MPRILVYSDCYHDAVYCLCYEDKEKNETMELNEVLNLLCQPHEETYEWVIVRDDDLLISFTKRHPDFDESECQVIVWAMCNHLTETFCYRSEYIDTFNECWQMAIEDKYDKRWLV